MSSPGSGQKLPLPQALALGALHGPAELLPISSSAHVTIVPWLLGWRYSRLDDDLRKTFEVALHAGTTAALVLRRDLVARRPALAAVASVPPAIAGYALERTIERRLGTPATIAAGLVAGAAMMAVADRAPQRRGYDDASTADALCLGTAQALALIPGVSRGGATLAAARARGFTREAAWRLSREAALPVITGATALKATRIGRSHRSDRLALAAGAGMASASALAAAPLLGRDPPLRAFAAYRICLAAAIAVKLRGPLRRGSRARRSPDARA